MSLHKKVNALRHTSVKTDLAGTLALSLSDAEACCGPAVVSSKLSVSEQSKIQPHSMPIKLSATVLCGLKTAPEATAPETQKQSH